MKRTHFVWLAGLVAFVGASAGSAGELNGNGDPNPLRGASICQFSGLNDDPSGVNPENGPPGRTQSFGQDVAKWEHDPRHPVLRPGVLCNPNNLPMKPIGKPD